MGLIAGKEVCDHSIYLSRPNHATVESDLQPAGVGDMFKKPYPRPYWADSKKQCAGMNIQVSARIKPMQTLPQPESEDTKPDPSISRPPLVAASVLGPSEFESVPHRPPHPAYTGRTPPIPSQTSQVAEGGYPSPRGAFTQEYSHVKQEPSENLVHPSIGSGSSEHALAPNYP